ncbi:YkvA family protein [Thermosynechococcaceae cyanobacterium BACA0444]|uniref:YkvA family protein n=1 Tax=Pseudocalidococcus azoricus BACA0444 TaxID=2918990 RepID=A0AAE4JWG6_9CYAN|nr:YkvA family protein [Pseudocalidococcus azoricus]MDS3860128.1 YkvA family protein [Pseudocalidococcus azoricus BACA0444]
MAAFYNWYRNTLRHPKYRWLVIGASLLYLFSPLDISPDLIPIVGQVDDVAVIMLLASEVTQMLVERIRSRKQQTAAPAAEQTVDVSAESF